MGKKALWQCFGLPLLSLFCIFLNLTGCSAQLQKTTASGTTAGSIGEATTEMTTETIIETTTESVSYPDSETSNPIQASDKTAQLWLYQSERLDIGIEGSANLLVAGDEQWIYFMGSETEYHSETGKIIMTHRVVSKQGERNSVNEIYSCQEKTDIAGSAVVGEGIIDIEACDGGNVVILTRTVDEQGKGAYYLKWIDPTGILKDKIQLSEESSPEGGLTVTGDGLAWLDSNAGIVEMKNGEKEWHQLGELMQYSAMGSLKDKTPWVKARTGESPSAWTLLSWNANNNEWNEIEFPFSKSYYTNISSGQKCGYDFLLWNSMEAVGWNVGDVTTTELVNFLASNIEFDELNQLVPLGSNCFLMVTDMISGNGKVSMLKPSEDATANKKTIIEIGCLDAGQIVSEIRQFNRENEKVKVLVRNYSQYGSEKAAEQLKLDVISGNAPDVFLINYGFPEEALISAGAFENLYLWLEQDSELKKEDFLGNILDAYSMDGCLYEMPVSFYIETYAAKTDIVGDPENMGLETLQKLDAQYQDSQTLSSNILRDDFLMKIVGSGLFIDVVKGECSFDSEEFVEILQFAESLPDQFDWTAKEWPQTRYDQILITEASLNSFYSFQWTEEFTYGDQASFFELMIPCDGMIQDGEYLFAMSSQSNNQEAVWEFLKYFWSEEYQTSIVDSQESEAFPVRISALEYMKQKSTQRDEGRDNGYYLNGTEVTIPTMTEEQIERYADYLLRVNIRYNLNYDIYNIVLEEASAFFEGQFDAEKVAESIQRRVRLYVWENQ